MRQKKLKFKKYLITNTKIKFEVIKGWSSFESNINCLWICMRSLRERIGIHV